jgi:Xaa-Pro aminopeptidase
MKNRVAKVQKSLQEHNLDALLIRVFESDNQNVFYLSGFGGSCAVLLITKKHAFIITDSRYFVRVAKECPSLKLVKHERGHKITKHINDALQIAGLKPTARVGFEADHVSVELLRSWRKEIKAKLTATTHLIERLRQYKDEEEISLLAKACSATCAVYKEVVAIIKPGMSESEVAFELDMRLRKHGALGNSFPSIVASGPNSAVPHHATGSRKLKAGEPVVLDFGGLFPGGYCSDITRTVFVPGKKPNAKMIEIYNIVLEANKAAFKALKPGILWREYDKIARDYISDAGYGEFFGHGLGHSLGLVAHDPYDYMHDPFKVGMVVTDEPGIYIEGFGGVRIEDDVVITKKGVRNLTNAAPYWKF